MKKKIDNLAADSTDAEVAAAIADDLLNAGHPGGPFVLGYNFDAKRAPPPIKCDKLVREATLCTVDRSNKQWCRQWLVEVLVFGLYVQRYAGRSYFTPIAGGSIKEVRQRIKRRSCPIDDDEIPF